MRFGKKNKNLERVYTICICLHLHPHSSTYTKKTKGHRSFTIAWTPYVALSSPPTHTHNWRKPDHFCHCFKVPVSTPLIRSGGCLFSFNYFLLLFFFPRIMTQKSILGFPELSLSSLHIFYSEIKRQSNERRNLTPCCSGPCKGQGN